MKAVILLSGGMDSTTLAYYYDAQGAELSALSFDYGQRHSRELEFADHTATVLGMRHDVVDLHDLGAILEGSALTGSLEVPDGHYSQETMKQTVVPNRNAIMLSIAVGAAVARGAAVVAAAMHAGDHPIYPDCRPEFIQAFDQASRLATAGFSVGDFRIETPFIDMSKTDIVRAGDALEVPWADTWSCYRGGDVHCGRCGTCVERQEAFSLAAVPDPTQYADPNYWRDAVAQVG